MFHNTSLFVPLPTINELQEAGNKHFRNYEYEKALEQYTRALDLYSKEAVAGNQAAKIATIYSNRAQTYLHLKRYFEAYLDSKEACALTKPTPPAKYLVRFIQAMMALDKYQQAIDLITQSTQHIDQNIQEKYFQEALIQAQQKAHFQNGHFNMEDINRQNDAQRQLKLCTWAGSISIRNSGDERGRGIYAAHDLKSGQLLLVEKAFAFCDSSQECDILPLTYLRQQGKVFADLFRQKPVPVSTEVQLLAQKIDKLCQNNSLNAYRMSLIYNGTTENCSDDTQISLYTSEFDVHTTKIQEFYQKLDVKKLNEQILRAACLCHFDIGREEDEEVEEISSQNQNKSSKKKSSKHEKPLKTGLWPILSFFNHSCTFNTTYEFIQDWVFVRALRDISCGEELCIDYFLNHAIAGRKQKLLSHLFAFQCTCTLCKGSETQDWECQEKFIIQLREDKLQLKEKVDLLCNEFVSNADNLLHRPVLWLALQELSNQLGYSQNAELALTFVQRLNQIADFTDAKYAIYWARCIEFYRLKMGVAYCGKQLAQLIDAARTIIFLGDALYGAGRYVVEKYVESDIQNSNVIKVLAEALGLYQD